MKPVLILQHLTNDGPAYLGTWLQRRQVPHVVLNAQAGEEFPAQLGDYSALAILGGEMSANDPLPSLRRAELLIREAVSSGQPVIGHCLGGQLMARALGAAVAASPQPEVGWQSLSVADDALAREWFGASGGLTVFQWHEEAFALPAGAHALASSAGCPHQAFAIGPHLALQFHIEIDETKLKRWSTLDTPHYREQQRQYPSVQSGAQMRAAMTAQLPAHQALADRLYTRWMAAVVSASA